MNSDVRLLEVFFRTVDRSLNQAIHKGLVQMRQGLRRSLETVKADVEKVRQSCWAQGFDLDFVEEILRPCQHSEYDISCSVEDRDAKEKSESLQFI